MSQSFTSCAYFVCMGFIVFFAIFAIFPLDFICGYSVCGGISLRYRSSRTFASPAIHFYFCLL